MAKNKKDDTPVKPEDDMAAELLLKDADDALRQEKLQAIWQEWGATIIGTALMVVFGTMVGVGWQNWQVSHNTTQTQLLLNAQNNPMVIEDLSGSHKGLYHLLNAEEILNSDDFSTESLSAAYQSAGKSGLPSEWNYLAQWGLLRTKAEAENADLKSIADDMVSLAEKNNNPYAPALFVEASMIYYKKGDYESATTIIEQAEAHKLATNPQLIQQIQSLKTLYIYDNKG